MVIGNARLFLEAENALIEYDLNLCACWINMKIRACISVTLLAAKVRGILAVK
jgi:hypothetical protein